MSSSIVDQVKEIVESDEDSFEQLEKGYDSYKLTLENREGLILMVLDRFIKDQISDDYLLSIFDEKEGPVIIGLESFFEAFNDLFVTGTISEGPRRLKDKGGVHFLADFFVLPKKDFVGLNPKQFLKKLKDYEPTVLEQSRKTGDYVYFSGPNPEVVNEFDSLLSKVRDIDSQLIIIFSGDKVAVFRLGSADYIETKLEREQRSLRNKFFVSYDFNSVMLAYRGKRMFSLIRVCDKLDEDCFKRVEADAKRLKKNLDKKSNDVGLIKRKFEVVGRLIAEKVEGSSVSGLSSEDSDQVARILAGLL